MTPEPCLNLAKDSRCYSHTACSDFGYCRERNMADGPPHWTTAELIAQRRRECTGRNRPAIAARIYFVRYAACTDLEPRPGWYVSTDDDCLYGPFETRREAQEAADDATPTHPEPRP